MTRTRTILYSALMGLAFLLLGPSGFLLNAAQAQTVSGPTQLFPGNASSNVLAMSQAGYVFGTYTAPSGNTDFFLWSAAAGVTDLGPTPANGFNSGTSAVSNAGQVAISEYLADGGLHGMTWTAASGWIDIGSLPLLIGGTIEPGDTSSVVISSINDSGLIVGWASRVRPSVGQYGNYDQFSWTLAGGMVDGSASTLLSEDITGLNESGQGAAFVDNQSLGSYVGYLWTAPSNWNYLGAIPGNPTPSVQTGPISQTGEIGGTESSQAFIWTAANGYVLLPVPNQYAAVTSINSQGQIAGYYGNSDASVFYTYFLNSATGSLNTVVTGGLPNGMNGLGQVVGQLYPSGDGFFVSQSIAQVDLGPGSTTTGITNSGLIAGNLNGQAVTWQAPQAPNNAPPTVTLSLSPAPVGGKYSFNQPVTAAYTCASAQSTIVACTAPSPNGAAVDTMSSGVHTFTVTAVDAFDNFTTQSISYTIPDQIPPTIAMYSPLNGSGFVAGTGFTVQALFLCADNVAVASCTAVDENGNPVNYGDTMSAAAGAHSLTVTAVDTSGNRTVSVSTYNVASAPAVLLTSPPNNAVYAQGANVTVSYACTAGLGIASCVGAATDQGAGIFVPQASGSPLNTGAPGNFNFQVTVTDTSGNTASTSSNYSVLAATVPPPAVPQPAPGTAVGPIDLGTLGGSYSYVTSISKNGIVIGQSLLAGDADWHSFVWTQTGGMVDTGNMQQNAVAASGEVVGTDGCPHGAVDIFTSVCAPLAWTPSGGLTQLTVPFFVMNINGMSGTGAGGPPQLGDVFSGQPQAVNANGLVAGYVVGNRRSGAFGPYFFDNQESEAAVWLSSGQAIVIPPTGGFNAQASAVNDNGQVVGYYTPASGNQHAFLWTQANGLTDLGDLQSGNGTSQATGINASGQVTGYANLPDGSQHGFFWTAAAGMVDIGGPDPGYNTNNTVLNDSGEIAGAYYDQTTGLTQPFVWTQTGGLQFQAGLGANSDNPLAINAGGQIVGRGTSLVTGNQDAEFWPLAGAPAADLGYDWMVGDSDNHLAAGNDYATNMATVWALPGFVPNANAPSVAIASPANGAIYTAGQNVLAQYACSDALGISSCAGNVPNGSSIVTSTAGTFVFTVTGVNAGGNITTRSAQYTVTAASGAPVSVSITAPAANASFNLAQNVVAAFACTSTSPMASCAAQDDLGNTYQSGAALNTDTIGTHLLTVTGLNAAGNTGSSSVTYSVVAGPNSGAKMSGDGRIAGATNAIRYRFAFNVIDRLAGDSHGRFSFWTVDPSGNPRITDTFDADSIASVVFSDNPAFSAGGHGKIPLADSVTFSGIGNFDGEAGYNFTVTATDQGQPGVGKDTFLLTVTDSSNNVVFSESGTLNAGDINSSRISSHKQPPFITGGPPTVVELEATGPNGAVVNYPAAAATDVNDKPVPVVCIPASGSEFPLGHSYGICSATDSGERTSTIRFRVWVADNTPPAISNIPANIKVPATASNGVTVTYTLPVVTDLVDPNPAISCSPASGRVFAIGTTTVACTARDASGNKASASFTVTVQDTIPPKLSNHANLTVQAAMPSGAVIPYIQPTATDIVDPNPAVSCTPASGSVFPLGTTTVNCKATDAAGNASASSFTVTVQDTIAPTIAIASPSGSYTLGQAATVSFSCSDSGSGVASCRGSHANGSAIDTSKTGSFSLSVTAVDAAGNSASKSVNFSVKK